jgi:ubiquinone/menaquinone biosynthesis C-methylase UbiE
MDVLFVLGPMTSRQKDSRVLQDVWNRVWHGDRYSRRSVRIRRARRKVAKMIEHGFSLSSADHLLDIGCGSGDVLLEIARVDGERAQFFACDQSPAATQLAASVWKDSGLDVHLVTASAVLLPFETASMSKVLLLGVLEHNTEPKILLSEVRRVLEPGGRLYITTSSTLSMVFLMRKIRELVRLWPYGYQKNYSPSQFCQMLTTFFAVESIWIDQTDFDFPVSALVDRMLHFLFPWWGRYIGVRCTNVTIDS